MGSGLRVWGLGLGAQGLGLEIKDLGLGFCCQAAAGCCGPMVGIKLIHPPPQLPEAAKAPKPVPVGGFRIESQLVSGGGEILSPLKAAWKEEEGLWHSRFGVFFLGVIGEIWSAKSASRCRSPLQGGP